MEHHVMCYIFDRPRHRGGGRERQRTDNGRKVIRLDMRMGGTCVWLLVPIAGCP
jgi:hypothetical protein